MKPRTLLILVGSAAFAVAVVVALLREVDREEASLAQSISGVVEVASGAGDLVKSDRLTLVLIDAATGEVAALKFTTPFVPPLAFSIGQSEARKGVNLNGKYFLLGLTDKDGDPTKPHSGEVIGKFPEPLVTATEKVYLELNQPFTGPLPELLAAGIRDFQGGSGREY